MESDFKFLEYLNQYRTEGICFNTTIDNEKSISIKEYEIIFGKKPTTKKPTLLVKEKNNTVDEEMTSKFIQRRFEDCKQLHTRETFIEDELCFLNSIEKETIEYFKHQYKPLVKALNEFIKSPSTKVNKSKKSLKHFSQRQVAIAYCLMGIEINLDNFKTILEKHCQTASKKILEKALKKPSHIKPLNDTKRGQTSFLNDLKEALRLLEGEKKQKVIKIIKLIISGLEKVNAANN